MKINYRPEIDGLRAIAVIAVILYHAQINFFENIFFSGGFIGVDIFFVISGYLITSLIIKELFQTNKFSFTYFYERRFRRLIPVLFFVMLASLPLGWSLLLPTSFVEFAKSIISSIAFGSNFFFYFSEIQYAAEDSFLKPFLHTWSLSVEEQFYIIFPILFMLLFKYFRKNIFYIIIIFIIISVLFANATSLSNQSLSFYILPTRGWELLSGSLLAYLEYTKGKDTSKPIIKDLLTITGLVLIILSFLYFTDDTLHPSYFTIVPILGVCIIIWFADNSTLVGKILSTKIFVGLGLISYSLYLWHYPSFAFARIAENFETLESKILIIFLTIILSIFSFFLIEKPCRNKSFSFKKIFYSFFMGMILIAIYCNWVINKDGFIEREKFLKSFNVKFDNYILDPRYYLKNHHFHFETNYIPSNFQKSENNLKTKVLIVGNSFGADFFKILHLNKNLYKNYDFDLISPKIRSLKMIKHNPYQVRCLKNLIEKNNFDCEGENFTENILDQFNKSDVVLLSTYWEDQDLSRLKEIILLIKQKNKKVIVVNQGILLETTTKYNFNPLDYFVYLNNRLPNKKDLLNIEKEVYQKLDFNKKRLSKNYKLKEISNEANINYLDLKQLQCDKSSNSCKLMTPEGYKIYWDQGHNTYEGADYLGKRMKEINWLKIN